MLTQWVSAPPSPEPEPAVAVEQRCSEHGDPTGRGGAGGEHTAEVGRRGAASASSPSRSPCAAGSAPSAALQPLSTAPRAPGGTRGFPPAVPKHRASWPAAGAGGDAALNSARRREGSSEASPRRPLAPRPQGTVVALPPSAGSEGHSIAPRLPGDAEPRGGAGRDASLPPGCARREQHGSTPVPRAGCPPALQGSRWSQAGHPKCVAVQDRGSAGAEAGGVAAEGLRSPTPQGRSEAEGSPLHSMSPRSREICEGAYQRLDSLEETIRELEMTISEIGSHRSAEAAFPAGLLGQAVPGDAIQETEDGVGHCADGTALDLSHTKADAAKRPPLSHTKPPLLPKPQLSTPQVSFLLLLLPCSALGSALMSALPPPPPAPSL